MVPVPKLLARDVFIRKRDSISTCFVPEQLFSSCHFINQAVSISLDRISTTDSLGPLLLKFKSILILFDSTHNLDNIFKHPCTIEMQLVIRRQITPNGKVSK